jgi:hypothetical protein
MTKRLASLVLLLTLGGSVMAGMPMHAGGDSSMMDCCKAALEQNDSPRVSAARLCCAMNCKEPASTNDNPAQSFSKTSAAPITLVVVALPRATNYQRLADSYSRSTLLSLKPAYILNLALLI